jgi:hypothetical protein
MEKIVHTKFITLAFLATSLGIRLASAAPATDQATHAKVTAEYMRLPMSFEINEGQSDPQVKALARGSGYGVFLTSSESVFVLTPGKKDGAGAVVRVRAIGANPAPKVSGLDRLEGHSDYYIGKDQSKWRQNVPNYARVKYDSIYPGVDLIYYGNQRQLEYDYVVAPGADPNSIRLAIQGARKLSIDANGDLLLETQHGIISQRKPVIYQQIDGTRHEVAGSFLLHGNRVSFKVGDYDHSKELVIDPSLVFLTYLGGSGTDEGKALTITTTTGVTLVAGSTSSPNFPTATPLFSYTGETDGFVTAIDPTGETLLDSTYVGGTGGANLVNGIAVDVSLLPAMLYVAGTTTSPNLAVTNAFQPTYAGGGADGWVARINLQVTIISLNPLKFTLTTSIGFVTYLGGTGADEVTGLAMDQVSKDVFVTGLTTSKNFPTTAGALQTTFGGTVNGFVTRFASGTGLPSFSTYIGGKGAVEPTGIATYTNLSTSAVTEYVVGEVLASATAKEGYFTALNGTGTASPFTKIIGSTTTATDVTGVTTDSAGAIYITGFTNNSTLPTVSPVQATFGGGGNDAFVGAYNSSGTPTFFSYWGGAGYDEAQSIGVFLTNNSDLTTSINLFIGGYTTGSLKTQNAVQSTYGGGSTDGFVTMFSTSHGSPFSLGYSTYIGGNGVDIVYGLAVGSSGNARITGLTSSTNLNVTPPASSTPHAFQTTNGGGYDAFVAEIQTTP